MKRFVSILLSLIVCFSCFTVAGTAATEYTEGDFTYTISDGNAKIVSFPETESGEISIPSKLGGYKVTEIGAYAFYACTTLTKITIPNTVVTIENYAFAYCVELEYIKIPSSVTSIGNNAFRASKNIVIHCPINTAAYRYANSNGLDYVLIPDDSNIYNLGEETYSFENFSDAVSGGHCFGMSSTSSGYYLGFLDVSIVDLDTCQQVNNCTLTTVVQEPICFYQVRQGSSALSAMVAGGTYYETYDADRGTGDYDMESDWDEVIDYVKNHSYDDSGSLQIGFRKAGEGGHAINFLRYSEVDGQERIYAYDNNFPEIETYFYKDTDDNVYQVPEETFSGSIDCIALRDMKTYFGIEDSYGGLEHCIYAYAGQIVVEGAKAYPLDVSINGVEQVVYEIPARIKTVKIVPLVDNAEFVYLDKTYSFGTVDEGTYAELSLVEYEDDTPEFAIITDSPVDEACSCNCHARGLKAFFFKLVLFFQRLLGLNSECDCGIAHY